MGRKIGILAYGSLIGDPGWEIEAETIDITRNILTPFDVEFARSSVSRASAPTLVPVDTGGTRVAAIIYEVGLDEQRAVDILYCREIHQVGSGRRFRPPPPDRTNAVRIDRLPRFEGYDVVLSTRISANINPLTPEKLADLAIESARELDNGRDGISYLIAAKENGIVTPLSVAYEEEIIRRLGAHDLPDALAICCPPATPLS